MSGLEKRKRKNGDKLLRALGPRGAMDLFVPIPTKTAAVALGDAGVLALNRKVLLLERILSRLKDTGFKQVALTHTVYGRPRDPDDRAAVALPVAISSTDRGIKILWRLHVVVENLSDVALFAPQSPFQQLLNEYDLLSISPRNEAAFQAACTCAGADIVSLEGVSSGNCLPFKLRASDIRAVVNRGAVLEIPYAVPVLNRAARKGLVQTSRELKTAAVGAELHVIFSSGSRMADGTDVGPMALRTPGDLANLLQAVLSFDPRAAASAVSLSGLMALDHAARRRFGDRSIRVTNLAIESGDFKRKKIVSRGDASGVGTLAAVEVTKGETTEDDGVDGFIQF